MEGCFACDVNEGRIRPPGGAIYADKHWVADHGIPPIARGYVVLKPRRHVASLAELDLSEAATLGVVAQRLTAAMEAVLRPERIDVTSLGESVCHLHFHLVPRYGDMPPAGAELLQAVFAGAWQVDDYKAADAAAQIRLALARGGTLEEQ